MNKKGKLNFTYRAVKDGKTIGRCQTHSKRRFYNRIDTINWQNSPLKLYLRVSYGRTKCNMGCVCNFYNDGWYDNKEELMFALDNFATERLPEMSEGSR